MDGVDATMDGAGPRAGLPGPAEYLAYYNLHAAPFPARAAASALWLGPTRRALLDALAGAIRLRTGVLVLTGDVGSGKTSLVDALVDTLNDGTVIAVHVPSFGLDAADFFPAVARACGLDGLPEGREAFPAGLGQMLDRASQAGQTVLLILDEAQRLGHELLGKVQELAIAGSQGERRLAILLVGQTELEAALLDARHGALAERIVARHVLEPLTADEVGDYIRHCLRAAGADHDIFSADAVREIARLSRGIPATIGTLCDRALLTGHQRRARTLRRHSIEDSWSGVESGALARPTAPRRRARPSGDAARPRGRAATSEPDLEPALKAEPGFVPSPPAPGMPAGADGSERRDLAVARGAPVTQDAPARVEAPAAPEVAVRAEALGGAEPVPPAGGRTHPDGAPEPGEVPRPSAFTRPNAPRHTDIPRRAAVRVRGHTRVRPRPILRRWPRLLVAGLAALFLIMGGYSFFSGQPAGVTQAPPPVAPSSPPAPKPSEPAPAMPEAADPPPFAGAAPPVRAQAGALATPRHEQPAETATDAVLNAPVSPTSRAQRPERPPAAEVSTRKLAPRGMQASDPGATPGVPRAGLLVDEEPRRSPSVTAGGAEPGRPQQGEPSATAPAPETRPARAPRPPAPAGVVQPSRSPQREVEAPDAAGVIDWLLNEYPRKNR